MLKSHITLPKSFINQFKSRDKQLYRLVIDNEKIENITTRQTKIFTKDNYFSKENEDEISKRVETVLGRARKVFKQLDLESPSVLLKSDALKHIDEALVLQFCRIERFLSRVPQNSLISHLFLSENDTMSFILNSNPSFKDIFHDARKGLLINTTSVPFVTSKEIFSNILINGETGLIFPLSPTVAYIIFSEHHDFISSSKEKLNTYHENSVKESITATIISKEKTIKYINNQIAISEVQANKRNNNGFLLGERNVLESLKDQLKQFKDLVSKQ